MIDEDRARMRVVKSWFSGEGGYGYILPEEGGEAVFVHHMCIAPRAKAKSLKKGVRVSYEVTRKKMAGLWAKNVCQFSKRGARLLGRYRWAQNAWLRRQHDLRFGSTEVKLRVTP